MVIYKVTCKCCGKIYIGNTQQKLKDRMGQHFTDVKNLVEKGKGSDTFVTHLATHFKENTKVARSDVRELTKTEVVWQGNPISCMKSFGKLSCSLWQKKNQRSLSTQEERFMVPADTKPSFTGTL